MNICNLQVLFIGNNLNLKYLTKNKGVRSTSEYSGAINLLICDDSDKYTAKVVDILGLSNCLNYISVLVLERITYSISVLN